MMEETYTFSRALHLMRYGGKKMKSVYMLDGLWLEVQKGKLVRNQIRELTMPNFPTEFTLRPNEIMGSWVEVK